MGSTRASPLRGQQPRAGAISFEPYSLKTYDQREHPAELGKLWVPENRSKNTGRLIQLAFVRLRSTAANPQPPIVFLAGGRGVPGTGMARVPIYFSLFERLRGVADVILLDQRGTGLLPALISTASRGEYSLLGAMLERLHEGFSNIPLMQFPMTCSDGASTERRQLAERQASHTLLGNPADLALDPKQCAEVGSPDLGQEFRTPMWSPLQPCS